jgi:translation initiation factor 5
VQDKKKGKDKKKDKDGGDEDKDKKKDKKDKKKDKKEKDKKEEKNGDKDYLKEAMFGKKEADGFGSDGDDASVASEAGVDDAGALKLAVDGTRKYIEQNPKASPAEIAEVVTNQQMASALKSHDKVQIIVRASITPQFFKNKEIQKCAPIITGITNGNRIMERHLISSLEALCIDKPKNFPVMIKQLYDEDALEEQAILEWADEGRSEFTYAAVDEDTRAALRGEAEPVVVWLQEADSEEESEEE